MSRSNYILQWGPDITHTFTNVSGSTIAQGEIVVLGDQGLLGVAMESIANAATGNVKLPGMAKVQMSVKGHDGSANAAISAYDKVYYTTNETFCDVDTTAAFAGFTLGGVASGATETEEVLLVLTPLA